MSLKALFLGVALGVVAFPPGVSHAEKVRTNQDTKIYSRAGEQASVVISVKEGKTMTVLAKDGRWIKVRVSGRTGWVPRSKVDLPEGDDEIQRNTRRRPFVDGRSTGRGFGGQDGPDDRVGADAVGDGATGGNHDDDDDAKPRKPAKPDKPSKDDSDDDAKPSKPVKEAKPAKPVKEAKPDKPDKGKKGKDDDEVVSVDDDDDQPESKADKGGDSKGDSDGGDAPAPTRPMAHVSKSTKIYTKASKDSDEAFVAEPKVALFVGKTKGDWTRVSTDDGDAGYVLSSKLDLDDTGGSNSGRSIDIHAGLGIMYFSQSVSTPVADATLRKVPDDYSAASSAFSFALGSTVLYPYPGKDRIKVGGELSYVYNKTFEGVNYMGQTTAFSYHDFNLRAVGSYDLQKSNGMMILARFGLHYDSFQVANVTNLTLNNAKIPSEIIVGPIFGGVLVIPKLTPKLGLNVSLDFIPFLGSVSQTKNLEDGTDPGARAFYLGGRLNYHYRPKVDLVVSYDLGYTAISFGGVAPATSMRGHMGTGPSSSSDLANALSFGAAYDF